MLMSFITGVLSSLSATVLMVLVARWKWPRILQRLSGSSLFRQGVEYCYSCQADAVNDIVHDLKASRTVRILCFRGYSVVQADGPFYFVLRCQDKDIRVILADPGDNEGDNPEIERRGQESVGINPGDYRNDVWAAVTRLRKAVEQNNSQVSARLHRLPALYRMYITDETAYVSFFEPKVSGSQLPILRISSRSHVYTGMIRHFDQTWRISRDIDSLEFHSSIGHVDRAEGGCSHVQEPVA
jgi:hypothetical protein